MSNKVTSRSMFNFRKSLLMFQFVISGALIIGTLIMRKQMVFLQDRELGMNTDQVMVIDYGPNSGIGNSFKSLKTELGSIGGVNSVTFSSHTPGQMPNGTTTSIVDKFGQTHSGEINLTLIDYDFIENYGLEIVAGRAFSPERFNTDNTSALILNESVVKAYGYSNPEDILGASFEQWGGNGTVIGVIKDFNYLSLHNDVGLLSLKMWPQQFEKISLKLSVDDIDKTIASLRDKWTSIYPNMPFKYYFVDDDLRAQYVKDHQFAEIIFAFTMVSSGIGILGLIAFATFWCERKRKEISVRKVLGAKTLGLLLNFYREFSTPVLISFLISIPISFYFGSLWLRQFAYQIVLGANLLLIPFVCILIIVGISVGVQSLKVVLANPVDNLNEE